MKRTSSATSTALALLMLLAASCGGGGGGGGGGGLQDDWVFDPSADKEEVLMAASPNRVAGSGNIGFSVGGAKDIQNFRANVEAGFLPLGTDVTHEGIYYDYSFETGAQAPCAELFCPSYSQMLSTHPLSGEQEPILAVGLNSGISAADFARKKLNLVVVLDISGSMGSPFDAYYYDPQGSSGAARPKMAVANEAIVAMLDHLRPEDRLGVVLFESEAHLGKPLSLVGNTNMAAIKAHILAITERGGTNMEAGYELGTGLFGALGQVDPAEYENRIIFLTDAMPNLGETGDQSLLGLVQASAAQKIYTTFIGIGVDFNTALVEAITKVEGANYYAVHSEQGFKQRLDEEFDFMVTPLVFDLRLSFTSGGYAIDAVYGSPEADQATGVLMRVNTLFPAKVEGGETRGGIVLLELAAQNGGSDIALAAAYRDRQDQQHESSAAFTFDAAADVAPNSGIRKAILLSRYVELMKRWIAHERELLGAPEPALGEWERESTPLQVSAEMQALIQQLLVHWQSEAAALNDPRLERESQILQQLASWRSP